jgi:hypothetical protein
MATITSTDWALTVADNGTTIWTGKAKVTSIRWSKYNGVPDVCVLLDSAGRDVFNENALATLEPIATTYGEGKWIDGLKVTTISSGEVIVSIL